MRNNKKIPIKLKSENQLSAALSLLPYVFFPSLLVLSPFTFGLTITEDFTGAKTTNNWLLPLTGGGIKPNDACITAGNNLGIGSATTAGSPPRCPTRYPALNNNFVAPNDLPGHGALRLTPPLQYSAGGIVSNFTFPTNEGIEVSFVTYTYGGSGADGITFFLTDGNEAPSLGASGGSLGYSCANATNKGQGIRGGYLGLGIDEFGNFLNQGDNTNTGFNARPGRIGLRGAGSINYYSLNKQYPSYYPSGLSQAAQDTAVFRTCQWGRLAKYNGGNNWNNTNIPILNYPALAGGYTNLSSSTPIGLGVGSRTQARPINYKLRITPSGLLSLWWSYNGGDYQPILVDRDIIATNGPLPSSFRFGFVGSTGGSTNYHDITCFKAAPAAISDNSAAVNLPEAEYETEAQIYITTYSPVNWWSSLTSQNIAYNTATGIVAVNPQANWDASCNLTGGVCNKTGGNTVTVQSPGDRTIITSNGTTGTAFQWNSLDTTQQGLLNAVDNHGQLRLNYLRGERDQELKNDGSGKFRKRTGVLGDIINNSSPSWVGPPTEHTKITTWVDKLTGQIMPENVATVQKYTDFKTKYNDRVNVLYVGANDGFLHGFRTGAYDSTGEKYKATAAKPNDGKELLAYMPADVLKRIHHNTKSSLDYSSPNYAHNYFNDATPGTGDLFYGGEWHTWLVSGLGSGGASIYALDVTDPEGTHAPDKAFTESNANKLVLGEWSYNSGDPVWKHLGNTHGKPEIVRFHNGQWGAVFGNGWCDANDATNGNCTSPTGKAGIYLMLLDKTTGVPSFKFLDTGVGSSGSPNGIAHVTPVDFDEDHIVDYVYAGDLQGNIWRFDLTDANTSEWEKSDSLFKLFSTPSGQPITSKLSVSYAKKKKATDATPRVMVSFGTGRKINGYLVNSDSYTTGTQSMYGVWDPNFALWNSKSPQKFVQYTVSSTLSKSMLTRQTVNATTNKMSNNEVCWANDSACLGTQKRFGWYMDLNSPEQIIYSPVLSEETDAILVNTFIPGRDQSVSCEVPVPSGFTYAFDIATGKGKKGYWDGKFNEDGYRLPLGATGSPTLLKVNGKWVMLTKDSKGDIKVTPIFTPPEGAPVKRLSWRIVY